MVSGGLLSFFVFFHHLLEEFFACFLSPLLADWSWKVTDLVGRVLGVRGTCPILCRLSRVAEPGLVGERGARKGVMSSPLTGNLTRVLSLVRE